MTSTRSSGELLLCRTLLCTIQYKSWNVCGTLHSLLWAKKRQEKVTSGPISGMLKRGLLLSFSWQQTTWIILEVPGHYSMSGGRVLWTQTGISVSYGNRKHRHIHKSLNTYTNTNIEVQWVLLCIGQYNCDIYRSKQFRLLETKVATKCVHMFGYASLLFLAASCMSTKVTHNS